MSETDRVPVAHGVTATGEAWTIIAWRRGTETFTFLEVIDAEGHDVGGGGFGGPLLDPGMPINTFAHRPGTGGTQLVGRADPSIVRVRLDLSSGEPIELTPTGDPDLFGVRFFAALIPDGIEIVAMFLYDETGDERAKYPHHPPG